MLDCMAIYLKRSGDIRDLKGLTLVVVRDGFDPERVDRQRVQVTLVDMGWAHGGRKLVAGHPMETRDAAFEDFRIVAEVKMSSLFR